MSLKTHSSKKHKSVKFDEYQLRMKLTFYLKLWAERIQDLRVNKITKINLVILERGLLIEIEGNTLHLEANPQVITRGHTEDNYRDRG